MLLRPWLPTMTWSWTVICMWRPASTMSRVRRMSCWLGRGIAARMVVDDDDRGRAECDRAADHLADIDRRLVDRASPHRLVADQHVLGVEEQDAHPLDRRMGHRRLEIIAQRLPARQDRPPLDPGFEQPQRARLGDLDRARPRRRSALRGGAPRRRPRAAGRSRRNRRSAPWPAAWCRGGGWRGRADIRPAHDRAAPWGRLEQALAQPGAVAADRRFGRSAMRIHRKCR